MAENITETGSLSQESDKNALFMDALHDEAFPGGVVDVAYDGEEGVFLVSDPERSVVETTDTEQTSLFGPSEMEGIDTVYDSTNSMVFHMDYVNPPRQSALSEQSIVSQDSAIQNELKNVWISSDVLDIQTGQASYQLSSYNGEDVSVAFVDS